jgi:hypothetical protein
MSPRMNTDTEIHTLIDLDDFITDIKNEADSEASLVESSVSDVDAQSDTTDESVSPSKEEDDSSSESSKRKSSVRFGSIEIREYERIVGDHPDVKFGPPMGIGWQYYQNEQIPIDEYERRRGPKKFMLRMSSITRKNVLRNVFNIPEQEIRSAEKEVQKIQKLRERSAKQSVAAAKVEETIRRPFRRFNTMFTPETILKSFAMSTPMGGMSY